MILAPTVITFFTLFYSVRGRTAEDSFAVKHHQGERAEFSTELCCHLEVYNGQYETPEGNTAEEIFYDCETMNRDIYPITLPDGFFEEHEHQLGIRNIPATVCIENGFVHKGEVVYPPNTNIRVVKSQKKKQQQQQRAFVGSPTTTGTNSVLIVMVNAPDTKLPFDADAMRRRVFLDEVSVANQFSQCSNGALTMEMASGDDAIIDGVVTLDLTVNITGQNANTFVRKQAGILLNQMGIETSGSRSEYEHVAFCVPPGTLGHQGRPKWAAFANPFGNTMFFNSERCLSMIPLMHEIGHTLGLQHASKGTYGCTDQNCVYGDVTGYMGGASTSGTGDPQRMCFNAAHHWRLNWFQTKRIDFNANGMLDAGPWRGKLHGFVEAADPSSETVLMHMNGVYVQYNRAISYNADTQAHRNEVVLTVREDEQQINSFHLHSLIKKDDGVHLGHIGIRLCGWDESRAFADISVYDISKSQASNCDGSTQPPTPAPTPAPTPRPSSTSVCHDDPDATFFINDKHGFKDCAWFATKANKQRRFCGWESEPDFACQRTCNSCDYYNSLDDDALGCFDADNEFPVEGLDGLRNCEWLASDETWQMQLCGNGGEVDLICERTCKVCQSD